MLRVKIEFSTEVDDLELRFAGMVVTILAIARVALFL
jgi:hypothetical protein